MSRLRAVSVFALVRHVWQPGGEALPRYCEGVGARVSCALPGVGGHLSRWSYREWHPGQEVRDTP